MKIVTVVGTRPEIIRLSQIIPKLDRAVDHVVVHTGQNSAPSLSDIFFEDLGVRAPDHWLGVEEADFARQIGAIMARDVLLAERPERLLVLGDTNSAVGGRRKAPRHLGVSHGGWQPQLRPSRARRGEPAHRRPCQRRGYPPFWPDGYQRALGL